ncbi:unnamed protein product [Triticum turgidum subsp. durum]|uniref:Protein DETOXIFICATION n=1 Tax=Triticum turgidum subsp. durum TaxID=4567 RepID=A0A9R0WPT7_TRITD|nr:unnamed protein product [Triticum turgidum subsp. durum]
MERQKNAPLLVRRTKEREGQVQRLASEVWEESMKLWEVVGPAVFMRLVLYSLNIISQSFAGHLGDRELAAFSIASTVVSGFNLGFLLAYAVGGGCPETWGGFSSLAFVDIWGFVKLSSASGVMLCLESWYYRVLIFVTGYMKNAELAVDALSICLSLNGLEMMIPLGFLAGTGVRVANELGAGNGRGARFATMASTTTSFPISIFFCLAALGLHGRLALIFSSSKAVIDAVDDISVLLALTILLNGVQPVLSGVAVGSGWQALVAYVNIGSYYLIGVPLGALLGWTFHLGVHGIWAGMIGGTTVQTLILAYMTMRCDWDQEALKASNRMGLM